MPEEHLSIKLPETLEEKAAQKEQTLTDEQEQNRGILPAALRNILIITGALLVISASLYFVILRLPGRPVREEPAPVEIATIKTGIPAAIREGLIGRVLGESSGPIPARAQVTIKNTEVIGIQPIGVIPHPYLSNILTGEFEATVTRLFIASTTTYTINARLPQTTDDQVFEVMLSDSAHAEKLGVLVRETPNFYTLSVIRPGYDTRPTISIVGPDPGDPSRIVTVLSGNLVTLQ